MSKKFIFLFMCASCSSGIDTGPCSVAELGDHEVECLSIALQIIEEGKCEGAEDVTECGALRPILEACEAKRQEWQRCQ